MAGGRGTGYPGPAPPPARGRHPPAPPPPRRAPRRPPAPNPPFPDYPPFAASTAFVSAGTTSNTSPTIP